MPLNKIFNTEHNHTNVYRASEALGIASGAFVGAVFGAAPGAAVGAIIGKFTGRAVSNSYHMIESRFHFGL